MREVLATKYCVVRDYSVASPALGGITCAEFWDEVDAYEYFKWAQRKWKREENKYPGQMFVWKLYKRIDYFHKVNEPCCSWHLMEG